MAGELAKGRGGAIARHRPHFGRKGKDLKLNRKGNIAGGNPKKSNSKAGVQAEQRVLAGVKESKSYLELTRITLVAGMGILSLSLVGFILYVQNK
jgi:preprotein translocase subunit Sss1